MMISRVEEKLTNIDGLVQALLFVGEHAEDAELASVRSWAVTLCYLADDNVRSALRALRIDPQLPRTP